MPSPADLVDDVLAEILLRLPPGCVLRSRAVSKRWLRITTSPSFIADYSRRRPPELLVYPDGYMMGHRARNALAAVDLAAGDTTCRRRLLRFHEPLRLVDSCDGLLLFAIMQRGFLVCNPATMQWAALPSPTTRPCATVLPSGFYFHRPSGEHRLLCIAKILPPPVFAYDPPSGKYRRLPPPAAAELPPDVGSFYYILSTAGAGARRLGKRTERVNDPFPSACVAIRGTLYWTYHPEAGDTGGADMVAFDTAVEAFRRIPMPPTVGLASHRLRVFDMGGRLAVSAAEEVHPRRMDMWALEDEGGGGGGGFSDSRELPSLFPSVAARWAPRPSRRQHPRLRRPQRPPPPPAAATHANEPSRSAAHARRPNRRPPPPGRRRPRRPALHRPPAASAGPAAAPGPLLDPPEQQPPQPRTLRTPDGGDGAEIGGAAHGELSTTFTGGRARWTCLLRIDGDLPRPRRRAGGYPVYEAVCVLKGGALVVAGGGWVVLYDVEGKRELSRIDHSRGVGNVSRCVYRASLAPLPEPDARPCPVDDVPGGEPLLHYCSPGGGDANVPSYGNRWGRDDTWVVPNEH